MNSYSLRARADGQTEVLEHAASVIGVFARPEHARQFYDWMAGLHVTINRAPEPEVATAEPPLPAETLPDDEPGPVVDASEGVRAALAACAFEGSDETTDTEPGVDPVGGVEAVRQAPEKAAGRAVARLRPIVPSGRVAPAMHQAEGFVARQRAQAIFAQQGAATCRLCDREFLASLSEPETCARCSKEMER